ncbi:hypothetical protein [Conexibacter sp. SYSU D00693]|uniref:hypothetical protein n=1 Tax=Conexibacter sp. SYSU D00693 TaxID=2812560 RepID=UPI00196A7FC3|nr:hypothetical protein [Conexibacter sp. SYSU D00693]
MRRRVAERLRALGLRVDGARAAAARTQAVASAYRVLARQVGLDPEADGLPLERLLRDRLLRGTFQPRGPVVDACAVAVLETGVPVWALDAGVVDGPLRVRVETSGALVVADDHRALAPLLGDPAAEHAPGDGSVEVVLFAVDVRGVPAGTVDEALWIAAATLTGDR